jgi:hypothetical protein
MFLFRPHKVQYIHLKRKIEELESILSSYLESLSTTRRVDFPYPMLSDLYQEINSVSSNAVKVSLLRLLNAQIISRLSQYNPKLFSMYQLIEEEITELTNDQKSTFECC